MKVMHADWPSTISMIAAGVCGCCLFFASMQTASKSTKSIGSPIESENAGKSNNGLAKVNNARSFMQIAIDQETQSRDALTRAMSGNRQCRNAAAEQAHYFAQAATQAAQNSTDAAAGGPVEAADVAAQAREAASRARDNAERARYNASIA